jgi:uncharacterized membrane protein YphA (DoxX/SURF4 family)
MMGSPSLFRRVTNTRVPAGVFLRSIVLVRLFVGLVFLFEGIQKFLYPAELGVGRFVKIGIPFPGVMSPFVGIVEILGGVLLLLGLVTRLASIALIIDMLVAIAVTKTPALLESGFWKMAHEARVDFSMLLGLLFLLIVGSGAWSVDGMFRKREPGQEARRE